MKITFRKVATEDADMLLDWKNEEDTRNNSIVTDAVIQRADHLVWLSRTLENPSVRFFIIEIDGMSAGDVRIDDGEISIRMDKRYRGMGVATQVISKFPAPLTAKIRAHNIPSMRVFIANGYRPKEYIAEPVPYYVFEK